MMHLSLPIFDTVQFMKTEKIMQETENAASANEPILTPSTYFFLPIESIGSVGLPAKMNPPDTSDISSQTYPTKSKTRKST